MSRKEELQLVLGYTPPFIIVRNRLYTIDNLEDPTRSLDPIVRHQEF